MARHTSALLAAVMLCAAAAAPAAHGRIVKVVASNCSDFAAAHTSLKTAYEAATTPARITLTLELACTGGQAGRARLAAACVRDNARVRQAMPSCGRPLVRGCSNWCAGAAGMQLAASCGCAPQPRRCRTACGACCATRFWVNPSCRVAGPCCPGVRAKPTPLQSRKLAPVCCQLAIPRPLRHLAPFHYGVSAGNFTCTDTRDLFEVNIKPANSTRQPPLVIDIKAAAKCRKGDRLISVVSASAMD